MSKTICGTCKYMEMKTYRGTTFNHKGYCYGMPPYIGGIRPMTEAVHQSCSLYVDKNEVKDAK